MNEQRTEGSPVSTEPTYPVGSVDTALRLLLALGGQGEVRLVDVARSLHVARSTAHRLLAVLMKYGFASQDPETRLYSAGPTWAVFGARGVDQQVIAAAQPVLARLAELTGETVQLLSLRSNGNVVCVTAAEGTGLIRAAARVGDELPGWLTAGGRILLGLSAPALRSQLLAHARRSWQGAFEADLDALVTRAGVERVLVQRDILELGTSAVAVAVRAAADRWLTLDVVLPTARLTADAERRITQQAAAAARHIEVALSSSPHHVGA
ncbi:IclR family transcriptional regulator [Microbacterium maritypicum]|uniref:IclR family transcriptional regulator n=1 Tax=Microbacterium maritypicum TaxID=33918 RepID=UPI00381F924D